MADINTPGGMQSAQGSDGSYSDRKMEPGFPGGEVKTVDPSNSFNDGNAGTSEGSGAASTPKSM